MSAASDLTAASWVAFSRLLDEVLELPATERLGWLDRLEAEHESLKPALRAVLVRSAGVETAQWLATLPHTAGAAALADESDLRAGALVGPYRLLRELGVGGMGAVWLAERADGTLKRQVALKLPRAAWSRGLAERMARERDILASLEHPNIARLYDAGTDAQGRPYLALEYVEGQPIDAYCRQRTLSVRQRLDLLLKVAQAVAFAHSRLVVHRDLKPSNVLVTADGQVRLLDFGIAKLMEGERTAETQLTQLAGRALTLDYASPEQIRGEPIGTASDVYSLGVLAYELLAGAKPYKLKRGSAAELEEAIAGVDAPLASAVAADAQSRKALKGDLDAILNKALKKEPDQRYATVDAFARDIERYLAGHRVVARPDSLAYRLTRFAKRYRTPLVAAAITVAAFGLAIGVGATALVILALLLGLAAALWQARKARQQAEIARVQARKAESESQRAQAVQEFLLDLFRANSADQPDPERARQTTARELLDMGAAKLGTALADQPESRLLLAATLGELYAELGLWPEASAMTAEQLAVARRIHGSGDPRVAEALIAHARALDRRDRDSASEVAPLLDEAERLLDAAGESESLLRARLHDLAAQHFTSLSVERARQHAERSVAIYRHHHPADPGFAEAIDTLSAVLFREGRRDEAAARLGEALTNARAQSQPAFRLAPLICRLGEIHAFRGDSAAADPLLREALTLIERVHGERSAHAVIPRLSLARHLSWSGRAAEARAAAERALADAESASPQREPFQLPEVNRLVAEVYWTVGDVLACRDLLNRAFAEGAGAIPDSFQYASLLADRALVATAEGELALAQASIQQARSMADRIGMGPQTLLRLIIDWADAELGLASNDAGSALRQLDALRARAEASGHRLALAVARAEALTALGWTKRARRLIEAAHAEVERVPQSERHIEPEAPVQLGWGRMQSAAGDDLGALPALQRSVALYRQIHVPLSPKRLTAEVALAACRARLGHADEARPVLMTAEAALAQLGAFGKPLRAEILALREAMGER
jgi:serine/threonine-protein kinase